MLVEHLIGGAVILCGLSVLWWMLCDAIDGPRPPRMNMHKHHYRKYHKRKRP